MMPPFKTQPIENFKKQAERLVKEDEIQRDIINALRLLGYIVLETSEHRRVEQCPKCKERMTSTQGRGCTPGVPDLLVSHLDFPPLCLLGLEVKGPKTPITSAQSNLARLHRIIIVYSVQEALDAVRGAHQKFKKNI